ncbi:hypothetical protein, partial [Burkholderia cenocepacia]
IGRVPSDESPSIVAREKKRGAPIDQTRTGCAPDEKKPVRNEPDGPCAHAPKRERAALTSLSR